MSAKRFAHINEQQLLFYTHYIYILFLRLVPIDDLHSQFFVVAVFNTFYTLKQQTRAHRPKKRYAATVKGPSDARMQCACRKDVYVKKEK